MKHKFNSFGLKEKPSYEDLCDYFIKDPDAIRYPDRSATIRYNSIQGQQYRGLGSLEMERQHMRKMLDREKDYLLRQFSEHFGLPFSQVRTFAESMGLHPFRRASSSSSPSQISLRTLMIFTQKKRKQQCGGQV